MKLLGHIAPSEKENQLFHEYILKCRYNKELLYIDRKRIKTDSIHRLFDSILNVKIHLILSN